MKNSKVNRHSKKNKKKKEREKRIDVMNQNWQTSIHMDKEVQKKELAWLEYK